MPEQVSGESNQRPCRGILYLVTTPIGNLEDITFRAIRILKEVDLIAAEDTRRTLKLLHHYGIGKRLLSYHQHSKASREEQLMRLLKEGKDLALVCDAGTPGISDPGQRMVRRAAEAGVSIVPIPGPTALITGLAVSGFPTDSFLFQGFLPARRSRRKRALTSLSLEERTLVFYEAPHRLLAFLEDIQEIMGNRYVAVGRELTKKYEEIVRGKVSEILSRFSKSEVRGEFVLVVAGASYKDAQD